MNKLKILTSTTREGRKGIVIANWIVELARKDGRYDAELMDLAEINLPLMQEPNHPRQQQYQDERTKKWSAAIQHADAFIIVLAEYNYGFPAPIKNALDHLYHEWRYKPVAIVSYGGVSGGMRAAQMLKQVLTTLSMMPLAESVTIPFFSKYINEESVFVPDETVGESALAMLSELARWSETMKQMRI